MVTRKVCGAPSLGMRTTGTPRVQPAARDATDHEAAEELVPVERHRLELERGVEVDARRRRELEDRLEQRAQVGARRLERRDAATACFAEA